MIIILGAIIVIASVLGGFMMGGGHPGNLLQIAEFIVICGCALGALIIMSPRKVLIDLVRQAGTALKGAPHNKAAYEEMFKALYEFFMVARRNGMIALEEHVMNPESSAILQKYPAFRNNRPAIDLLCGALRPIIDGKVKPDQLKLLLDIQIQSMEEEHEKPINVLTRAADAMPGFGIVAAVLGIVITMSSIAGPIEQIGHHVAAALVGTFLGILLSYGFLNPLAVNMEFVGRAQMAYSKCIASSVIGFANGMAPIMAVEMARRGLDSELRPSADELEKMLKQVGK